MHGAAAWVCSLVAWGCSLGLQPGCMVLQPLVRRVGAHRSQPASIRYTTMLGGTGQKEERPALPTPG